MQNRWAEWVVIDGAEPMIKAKPGTRCAFVNGLVYFDLCDRSPSTVIISRS